MLQVTSKEMKINEKKTFTVAAGYNLLATGLIHLIDDIICNRSCKSPKL